VDVETIIMETDAAPLSGSSFYFPAVVDAATTACLTTTIMDADAKALSGSC